MSPAFLTNAEWSLVTVTNNSVVMFTLLVIAAAVAFLAAHAIIPSLVVSNESSSRTTLVRRVLYTVAALAFFTALFSLSRALINAIDLISRIYPRWLI
ncbi:MAG: hypothetical protein HY675_17965 [Chloroflexi bacterium]|nr:hypothetical protein [Chloroflexota bacterium]